jgi:hypothetical protein
MIPRESRKTARKLPRKQGAEKYGFPDQVVGPMPHRVLKYLLQDTQFNGLCFPKRIEF